MSIQVLSRRVKTSFPMVKSSDELQNAQPGNRFARVENTDGGMQAFVDRLTLQFLRRLPTFVRPSGKWTSTRKAIGRYLRSVAALSRHAESLGQFLDILVAALTELRTGFNFEAQKSGREAVDELRALIRDKLRYRFAFGPSVVSAQLAASDKRLLHQALEQDVKDRCEALSRHIARVLVDGVRGGVFGRAEWPDSTNCQFTYSRFEVALQDTVRTEMANGRIHLREVFRHSVAEHRIDVINAARFRGIPLWMPVPQQFTNVLKAVPDYLSPFLTSIDGLIIREHVRTREIMQTETAREIEIPLARPATDPAICIGNVVLFGWTPRDFPSQRSLARRACGRLWRGFDYLQASFEQDEEVAA